MELLYEKPKILCASLQNGMLLQLEGLVRWKRDTRVKWQKKDKEGKNARPSPKTLGSWGKPHVGSGIHS